MKKVLQDRRSLTLILFLTVICVFTLTVVYSALSAVLTINGNAEVVGSTWDIRLENPKVKSGSVNDNLPTIKSHNTLEFETVLEMPGDYYEFTVDVVNHGSIDAMIENVVKTPELTADQAKYLKYEVSYLNGENISSKQIINSGMIMPIKIRVEYRKDLIASELPIGQVVLDLSLTLEYVQSDSTSIYVEDSGYYGFRVVEGDYDTIGSQVCLENECFYVIDSDSNNVKLLAKYNLHVGLSCKGNRNCRSETNATGKQNYLMKGYYDGIPNGYSRGTVKFATESHMGSSLIEYTGSIVETYVNEYIDYLLSFDVDVVSSSIISQSDLEKLGCSITDKTCTVSEYTWLWGTSYWTTVRTYVIPYAYGIDCDGKLVSKAVSYGNYFGVRPVITISKLEFER